MTEQNQTTFDINAVMVKIDVAEALPEGRHAGTITKIEPKLIKFADETKERLVWTFTTADGKSAAGFSGFACTPKSKLYALMLNLGGIGKPLSSHIGRAVSFTVKSTGNNKTVVDLNSVVPA